MINDASCLLCSASIESRDRLFFECSFSATIWSNLLSLYSVNRRVGAWPSEFLWAKSHLQKKSFQSLIIRVAWAAAIYHIWRERNRRFFTNCSRPTDCVLLDICSEMKLRFRDEEEDEESEKEEETTPTRAKRKLKNLSKSRFKKRPKKKYFTHTPTYTLELDDFKAIGVTKLLKDATLKTLATLKVQGYEVLMKDFYDNMTVEYGNKGLVECIKTTIKGKRIKVTTELICEVLKIKPGEIRFYDSASGTPINIPKTPCHSKQSQILFDSLVSGHYNSLKPRDRILMYTLTRVIMPRKNSRTVIKKLDQWILACLIKKSSISFGTLILHHMTLYNEHSHGSLITLLAKKLKITPTLADKPIVLKKINSDTLVKMSIKPNPAGEYSVTKSVGNSLKIGDVSEQVSTLKEEIVS
ncbi:hypothetical protein Tsubulata_004438 [Turnera subulata]|uniref:Putative plant transposon protein domain-containing protein n=1 Tax=Turnera subulata TaxID=218843 RepID=A0A9Q0GDF2_9ROSI|nr:hypothetical protein Tsubulata_004438 [Turnera subulata]